MRHCTPDELMDVLEGLRDEQSMPHLAACAQCRDELQRGREALAAVRDVPVPEPPPFALDQLSARVRAAVAAEAGGESARGWLVPPLGAIAALAAAVVLAVVLWPADGGAPAPPSVASTPASSMSSSQVPSSPPARSGTDSAAGAAAPSAPPAVDAGAAVETNGGDAEDDASFAWISALAGALPESESMDVSGSGWSLGDGASAHAADVAVTGLSPDEQRELARLLKEAMGSSGA